MSPAPRDLRLLVALVGVALVVSFGFAALDQYAVTWDEALGDFFFGQRYLSYFTSFDPVYLDFAHDPYPPGHVPDLSTSPFRNRPWEYYPAANTLAAATSVVSSRWLGWLDPFDGFHALNVVLAGLLVWFLFRFLDRRFGLVTAAVAVGLLFTAPRVVCDLMANVKDFPLMVVFSLTLLAFYRAWERGSAAGIVAAGGLWGLALATKANAVFLPLVPLGLAMVVPRGWPRPRRRLLWAAFAAGILGIAVMIAVWPYLWADPLGRLAEHARFLTGRHQTTRAESLAPTFEAVLLTTPPVFLGLFGLGLGPLLARLRQREPAAWLLALWLADVPVRYLLPGAINYDGVRHFLEIFPPMAAIAGLGAAWLAAQLARLGRSARAVLALKAAAVVSLLIPGAWATLATHPHQIAYWNVFAGGPAGAFARGFPQAGDYWGMSYRQGLEWLGEHAGRDAVLAVPVIEHAVRLVAPLRLRRDLALANLTTPFSPELRPGWRELLGEAARGREVYVMFVPRRDWWNALMAECLRLEPVARWELEGAPVLLIYRWPGSGAVPTSAVDDPQHGQTP